MNHLPLFHLYLLGRVKGVVWGGRALRWICWQNLFQANAPPHPRPAPSYQPLALLGGNLESLLPLHRETCPQSPEPAG